MERIKKIAAALWQGMQHTVVRRVLAAVLMCTVTLSVLMGVSVHTRVYTVQDGDITRVVVTMSDAPYLTFDGYDTLWVDNTAQKEENGLSVEVFADGQSTLLYLTEDGVTVSDALTQAGVTLGEMDTLNQKLDALVTDGMSVQVERVVYDVEICADGETTVIGVTERDVTVADVLTRAGVTVGQQDRVSVDTAAIVTGSIKVQVDRVTYEEYTAIEKIPYETTYRYSCVLKPGKTKVDIYGRNGEQEVTYRKCYVNGELESTEQINAVTTTKAKKQVILKGSAYGTPIAKTPANANIKLDEKNQPLNYSRVIYGSVTAYHGDTATSTGRKPGVGVVAVDPREIPYGSILWIASPDGSFVYGYAIAGDTGGFIHNSETVVDLYMDSVVEMNTFGRRNLNVYVIQEGNGK